MKKVILSAILMALVVVSCNQKSKETEKPSLETPETAQMYSCSMHPEVIGKKGEKCSKCGMDLTVPVDQSMNVTPESTTETKSETTASEVALASFSIKEIVSNYLNLKNALVKEDSKTAANSGKALVKALGNVDTKKLNADQKKTFAEIADDVKEHAEHIGNNAGKIEHQREHFAMLSNDINDLVSSFGTTQKLYQDYCPMADNGKGAIWISETKEIKNPYYGSKMLTCGSIKKEI